MARASTGDPRTHWGRARLGDRRIPAMAVAIPTGLLLAVGVGGVSLWTGVASGERALLAASVFATTTAGVGIGLVWAIVVDRATLRGAVDRPDESVESNWLGIALQGAFGDTFAVTGLGAAILAITGLDFAGTSALTGVLVVAFLSATTRYVIARNRG